jgi:hypothetical protein
MPGFFLKASRNIFEGELQIGSRSHSQVLGKGYRTAKKQYANE